MKGKKGDPENASLTAIFLVDCWNGGSMDGLAAILTRYFLNQGKFPETPAQDEKVPEEKESPCETIPQIHIRREMETAG